MFRRIENASQYESFEECVQDLKARYRRTHRGEVEGLHYQFGVTCNQDGQSGFIEAERLEALPTGTNPRTESLLIEGNRVSGLSTGVEGEGESHWLEWGQSRRQKCGRLPYARSLVILPG
jgi:hypothetical protein